MRKLVARATNKIQTDDARKATWPLLTWQFKSSASLNFVITRRYESKTRVLEKPQRENEFERCRADPTAALST
jgi:hypothetical protein